MFDQIKGPLLADFFSNVTVYLKGTNDHIGKKSKTKNVTSNIIRSRRSLKKVTVPFFLGYMATDV